MKTIRLHPFKHNKEAIVDDCDFNYLSKYRWNYFRSGYREYARRHFVRLGKQTSVMMHRQIMAVKSCQEVDHINLNGLDNRRVNLRVATHAQNMMNRTARKDSISKLKGIRFVDRLNKWQAVIDSAGKRIYIGIFRFKKDAVTAYNNAAVKYHGEFARLNKP